VRQGRGRCLLGMELARARAGCARDPDERREALARAGDAYERARRPSLADPSYPDEAERPGAAEDAWRLLGRLLARILAATPGLRHGLEDRLLAVPARVD